MPTPPPTQQTLPLLILGTYLFLPLTYLTLLSSPLLNLPSTSKETACTLIVLVLLIHIYTFGIGYLVHVAMERRKVYLEGLGCLDAPVVCGDGEGGSGAGGFGFVKVMEGIRRWRDGDGHHNNNDADGECEVLPLYNLPPSPSSSPYSESNSHSLPTHETPYGTAEWEEWDSDNDTDNDSAAKFGWEDQTTPPRSPGTEESGEESAQTWQQAAGEMVVGEEGFWVVGLGERVKGWKGMMGLGR
ncbi:hypothetical protein EG328_008141 [Venturia inaequalis]|uniref:Uncharacterized protein n=1 Tax=Venturia inaequalis TaxID=5025 RepID=A0A8H3UBQ3_VENIN|nr:hypothetical protein EG328_008141 [Venturia inaequalis]KAE9990217.1 hypothetical protein EG327_001689 [Venturia inaequalis]RDI83502.1 hypothetical protein Vi05172_g6487 [Venturia inaequalis]